MNIVGVWKVYSVRTPILVLATPMGNQMVSWSEDSNEIEQNKFDIVIFLKLNLAKLSICYNSNK